MSNPQDSKPWAAYFVLMCIFFVVGLFFGTKNIASFVNSVLTGVSLIGVWGYISQKAIGSRVIWAVMFVVQLLGAVATLLMLFTSNQMPLAILLFVVALTLPLLIGLFRYAFRSNGIWLSSGATDA
jgi:hypothetical protein